MSSSKAKQRNYLPVPEHLAKVIRDEFPNPSLALELFAEFIRHRDYNRALVLKLAEIARDGQPWSLRRLATLMIENLFLKLSPDRRIEIDFFFTKILRIKDSSSISRLGRSVLKDGYTSPESAKFARELRDRLSRLNRIHKKISGSRMTSAGLQDFVELARHECKLSLARYFFSPEEVVGQIMNRVQTSMGLNAIDRDERSYLQGHTAAVLSGLPDYEIALVRYLCHQSRIYWVSESVSSEVNALVENPLTTVVLVVKPPGSDTEIEIKRTGVQGKHLLNVIYKRNGTVLPESHHLQGGSTVWTLLWERNLGCSLRNIYAMVHGEEPSMSSTVSTSSIYGVPVTEGESRILDYFTSSETFGDGFDRMRRDLKTIVETYKIGDPARVSHSNAIGLSGCFLGRFAPAQSIVVGTTSFRLDKIALYLSDDGPREYFKDLGMQYSDADARRLAEQVLEEILGQFTPPKRRYCNQSGYVRDVLSQVDNRHRADRIYLSVMEQIGKYWGTLLGIGGSSDGESFVTRNVGLKSSWSDGEWKVKMIFMDHDGLTIPGLKIASSDEVKFDPAILLKRMENDAAHIFGASTKKRMIRGEIKTLDDIYQPGQSTRKKGRYILKESLRLSYKKTIAAISNSALFEPLLHPTFSGLYKDWNTFVAAYLAADDDSSGLKSWKKRMTDFLTSRGYRNGLIKNYVASIEKHSDFIKEYRFIYER